MRAHHPETSQSQPGDKAIASRSQPIDLGADRNRRLQEIRKFAKQHNIKQIDGKSVSTKGAGTIYQALLDAGIDVPEEIKPPSKVSDRRRKAKTETLNPAQANETDKQRLHADDSLPVVSDWTAEANPGPAHPAFAEHFDIDAVREHVNREVQRSDRPADFKRAIELLTELDRICTDAWYRRQPEPWGHDDWAHVSSEIEALHSIVGQRAEETADELLRKSTAVKVESTVIC